MRKRSWQIGKTVFGVCSVVTVLGLLLGVSSSFRLKSYTIYSHWSKCSGIVTSSEVAGKRAFVPKIVYSYTVSDSHFTGTSDLDVPGFGARMSRLEVAEDLVNEYPVGKQITVFYDPEEPRNSLLKITAPWDVYAHISLGVVLVSAGAFFAAGFVFMK